MARLLLLPAPPSHAILPHNLMGVAGLRLSWNVCCLSVPTVPVCLPVTVSPNSQSPSPTHVPVPPKSPVPSSITRKLLLMRL